MARTCPCFFVVDRPVPATAFTSSWTDPRERLNTPSIVPQRSAEQLGGRHPRRVHCQARQKGCAGKAGTARAPRRPRTLYGAFHFFRAAAVHASDVSPGASVPGGPWPPLLHHPETRSFHWDKVSSRFLCYPGSETTKGVIYYCVRVVYAREVCAPNAVPPAFLCATYNRGRCSVFLHITVYNMHIVLEACSPSASVSGVWVYLRRKKKKHAS